MASEATDVELSDDKRKSSIMQAATNFELYGVSSIQDLLKLMDIQCTHSAFCQLVFLSPHSYTLRTAAVVFLAALP